MAPATSVQPPRAGILADKAVSVAMDDLSPVLLQVQIRRGMAFVDDSQRYTRPLNIAGVVGGKGVVVGDEDDGAGKLAKSFENGWVFLTHKLELVVGGGAPVAAGHKLRGDLPRAGFVNDDP
jgi:hypothetical protein